MYPDDFGEFTVRVTNRYGSAQMAGSVTSISCWLMILMLFAFHSFFLLDSVVSCCILFVGSLLAGFRSQSCLVG